MQKTLLLVPLFAVACSYPRFVASKTIVVNVPLAQALTLDCKTHNGDIKIARGEADDMVHVVAKIKVRGHTQEEADRNLERMSVGQGLEGKTLRIYGDYPRPDMNNRSPSFSFTMQVPEHLALKLESHNGDIESNGTTGTMRIETHNGDVRGTSRHKKTWVKTHNGEVRMAVQSEDDLDGRITSHNGDIVIQVPEEARCWLEAATHNGKIKTPSAIHDATIKRRSVLCRLGEEQTEGRLYIQTHNGNIVVRDGTPSGGNAKKLK
jgi:DUF4097 and DUF4098 domain-containing protein YvlB